MSSETPSLAECIAFMSFCVKDESTIVLREHMAEGLAIVGYLRDLAAARRDAQDARRWRAIRYIGVMWLNKPLFREAADETVDEWLKNSQIPEAALAADERK